MPQTSQNIAAPDLSVVVPVYNAAAHLPSLADTVMSLQKHGLTVEMIMVDDGSSDDSQAVAAQLAANHDAITALAHERNSGAGIARNTGWDRVTGRYTIFFDADDHLHPDVIAPAIALMDGTPEVDCTMFGYRYEREETADYTGMLYGDQAAMDGILMGQDSTIGTLESMGHLLKFTNYPWNKIIRTAHFKECGLRYGRNKVHNDILGHWMSLLLARKIRLTNAVMCTHIVHPQGSNLTNRKGRDRLYMFDALNELYDLLESRPELRRRYAHHFWALSKELYQWGKARITEDFLLTYDATYADLLRRIDLGDYARIRTKRAPALASSIAKHLIA